MVETNKYKEYIIQVCDIIKNDSLFGKELSKSGAITSALNQSEGATS